MSEYYQEKDFYLNQPEKETSISWGGGTDGNVANFPYIENSLGVVTDDSVNHPTHYTDGKIEVIDYIFDKGLGRGYCLGSAIKYISRAGKKDGNPELQDLKKAIKCIELYVEFLEGKR